MMGFVRYCSDFTPVAACTNGTGHGRVIVCQGRFPGGEAPFSIYGDDGLSALTAGGRNGRVYA